MQVKRIRLVLHARKDIATPSLSIKFKRLLRPYYAGTAISAITVPFDHDFDSAIDEAHDLADRAIQELKRSRVDMAAHLMPLSFTLEDSKSGREDGVRIVLIAVAHEKGLGAFKVARASPLSSLPARAAARALKINEEIEGVMRPRKKHPMNPPASSLANQLAMIVTNDIANE